MTGFEWWDYEAVLRLVISSALEEDAARRDVTTGAMGKAAQARHRCDLVAGEELVVCGWSGVEMTYDLLGCGVEVRKVVSEGRSVTEGGLLGTLTGPAGCLLQGERVALNVLCRLSGVATLTSRVISAVEGTGVDVLDTRKTVPGMRALQRHAVGAGGGQNHRFDLAGMGMIKDNHIQAMGGIDKVSRLVGAIEEAGVPVEVEVDSIFQLKKVLTMRPDRILLDNMSPREISEAVSLSRGTGIYIEASGGIDEENAREIAETGVDGISVGSLTHSAPAVDISFEWRGPC
ncbi:carboxylating nicotinate-nucleotide diphosphorylase [Candidatus Fermentibacteria bacterium]|nr:carboxylating nicotinate-nucleotide diphosphorylase [Candidatus Fermentibacteria bacterium]